MKTCPICKVPHKKRKINTKRFLRLWAEVRALLIEEGRIPNDTL